eukprot:scaffold262636_cov16-Prasinocladus_malaysianus.AAC.1
MHDGSRLTYSQGHLRVVLVAYPAGPLLQCSFLQPAPVEVEKHLQADGEVFVVEAGLVNHVAPPQQRPPREDRPAATVLNPHGAQT